MKSGMLSNQSLSLYITPFLCMKRGQSSLSHQSHQGGFLVWFFFSKGPCFGCAPEAATLTVTQIDTSSWMERNQDYGACKSASRAAHVCVTWTALTSSTLLWGETRLTSGDRTRIQSQQHKHGDPSEAEQGLFICIRMKRKIKGSGIPIFEQSLALFLHLFYRDSAGDLVTIQKQACGKFLTGSKKRKWVFFWVTVCPLRFQQSRNRDIWMFRCALLNGNACIMLFD